MILQHINDIATICAGHGIKTAIISPGSRSAALTLAFVRHPDIETKVISDERSAAFIALGIAQQQKLPVALICTSGSAAYNYAPAIAEAFYQEIPLIILTADRPAEWTNQYDGQTIQQSGIYGKHVLANFDLPADASHKDVKWHCNRVINEAIIIAKNKQGPVHVNVPIREPFYPERNEIISFPEVRIIQQKFAVKNLDRKDWIKLGYQWQQHSKKAIVLGQLDFDKGLQNALYRFAEKAGIPVIADIISNLQELPGVITNQDSFLNPQLNPVHQDLAPTLLITVGKSLISKNLKLFLRNNPPTEHWHISPSDRINDTLQHLTQTFDIHPETFFTEFIKFIGGKGDFNFINQWQNANLRVEKQKEQFVKSRKFSELQAFQVSLGAVPNKSILHFANSMSVRYANILGLPQGKNLTVFANRGTSGIDGSNSTAVGAALSQKNQVVLFTGDMAFFYDRNAFWHNYNLKNLRVIVFNNNGGGIFKMIDGPKRQAELEEYFVTKQVLSAENTAKDFGFEYQTCANLKDLKGHLESFYLTSKTAKILEIKTNADKNTESFNEYKKLVIESFSQ
ncbi:MAG: 2-succinyl-5-enolpyruvyl-6-hydroxy-3-cyclohexene-1-carboxylic-acid synthase [Cytophagales bacterium CG12_big_fil_rev_8_21_14_0_65_40_12]|nr:MAG: 2-succinyl-5-enolpyruvyl-6-hydroxy-3-cyclohexene-1-carboxylic-acid synthase [Cytophagales bacterium CG12_big_fil_rev_8_21_14_0_65_40_12]PIW05183.1 MAG: 2-succinyl-5-enolpyruvyl-6-hydroxy-3-cyclohexene-1-carboxylic-acid synthase [Cytophagales bacterium CG17_big_fil_post_rev_8_21_14_2_50_40_13]